MQHATPLVLTVLVFGYALFSERVHRSYIAPALIFILLGMALGPFGFHLLDAGPGTGGYTLLAQVALTVILFNQAAKLGVERIRSHGPVTLRLLAIGIPVSLVLGLLTALVLLPVLPFWEAVCLAAIVAPTEIALIEVLVSDRRVPERVRHALSVESGFYDGFALAVLFIALGGATADQGRGGGHWAWFIFSTEIVSLVAGGAIGLVGGLVLAWSQRRTSVSDLWAQLATLALALICFEVGERLHASGFVAAYAGGLAFAFVVRRAGREAPPTTVSDAAGQLLELLVFAMFGAFAVIDGWRQATWQIVLFAVIAVFAVRLVAVSLALLGSGLPGAERRFVGWFGPRGIGTVVLGLLVVQGELGGEVSEPTTISVVVVVTVTVSLVLHSLTAWPGVGSLERSGLSPRP